MKTKRISENVECEKPARERVVNWDESNIWPGAGNRSVSGAMRNAESGRYASGCRAERGKRFLPLSGFKFQVSAFLFFLSPLLLRASGDPSLYPDGRQREELRPNERNPFIQAIPPEAVTTKPEEGATEEARLRRILRAMKIGGVSKGPDNKHVLLGSMILKPGKTLPQILNNQIEVLRVLSVNDNAVVLEFVEKDPSVSTRQLFLPFSIKPEVTQMMVGEAFEELTKVGPSGKISAPPLTNAGVDDFLKGSREADLRNVADRDVKMMGVPTNAENSPKGK